jgi:hypothetical protein
VIQSPILWTKIEIEIELGGSHFSHSYFLFSGNRCRDAAAAATAAAPSSISISIFVQRIGLRTTFPLLSFWRVSQIGNKWAAGLLEKNHHQKCF